MKQFQKYGVAAAVASMAAAAVGAPTAAPSTTKVSQSELGDLAIVPYYTVNNGFNTGVHIINTSDATQVVKFRLRRGADSKDALDFNLVMSPRDEWTGNITAGGDNGVIVETNDTTCTVPEFPAGGAPMPATYAEGATEGYIEIIAMAQTTDEKQPIAVAAKHSKGVPADCDEVRQNFFRVADGDSGTGSVKGVHHSSLTSNGSQTAGDGAASIATNLSNYGPSDNALKVSFMITDSEGGLEFGDNAVMIEDFSNAPMMTNQQALSFGTDGLLNFDALNFELPNLNGGAYNETGTDDRGDDLESASLYNGVREALAADKIMNDWAAIETDTATVATDWIVTLPGQYVMTNPICGIYEAYDEATAGGCTSTALAAVDKNELPLTLASNPAGDPTLQGSNMILWDREEKQLNGTTEEGEDTPPELGFSPSGSASDPAAPNVTASLKREVNVISFNGTSVLGTADSQEEDLGLGVTITVEGGDRGWAELSIAPQAGAAIFNMTGEDGANVDPNGSNGSFTAVDDQPRTAVVGMAVWERQFSGQAGNYGRAIEHSTMVSSGYNSGAPTNLTR